MKYIKIYESFWEDYQNKYDKLNDEYYSKIKNTLIHILNTLITVAKEEIKENIELENGSSIIIEPDPSSGGTHEDICIDRGRRTILMYPYNINNTWYIEDSAQGNGILSSFSLYDMSTYIDMLVNDFSFYLNLDTFKKLNN